MNDVTRELEAIPSHPVSPAAGFLDPDTLPPQIATALRVAFGGASIEQLAPLSGGLSGAHVFAFTVQGASFVVRCGDINRAPHEVECLTIASARGVAPRLLYADARTGVSVTARVGTPLGQTQAYATRRRERVAATLRRLHEGPTFPPSASPSAVLAFFDAAIRARTGEGLPRELPRALDRIAPAVARFWGTAPCHNDVNPNNVLEAAEGIYLIDWEQAGAGDPYVDLGQLGVLFYRKAEERDALLAAYLGRPPTPDEAARARLGRIVALACYAGAFFFQSSLRPRTAADDTAPDKVLGTLSEARERVEPNAFAMTLLGQMADEMAGEAFADAVERLRE